MGVGIVPMIGGPVAEVATVGGVTPGAVTVTGGGIMVTVGGLVITVHGGAVVLHNAFDPLMFKKGSGGCDPTKGTGKTTSGVESVEGVPLTQKAKRDLAKDLADVPRSAQPTAQGRYREGLKWWEYTDSQGKTKIIVEHSDGTVHVGTPKPQSTHHRGGPPKYYPEPGTGYIGE